MCILGRVTVAHADGVNCSEMLVEKVSEKNEGERKRKRKVFVEVS
jgi:hypothetical protein